MSSQRRHRCDLRSAVAERTASHVVALRSVTSFDLHRVAARVLSRRTLIRSVVGGIVLTGLTACADSSADESATSPDTEAGAGQGALAGEPVEVWRDPG